MFAAVITRESGADPRETATGDSLVKALTPQNQADATGCWSNGNALIAQSLTWNTATSKHEDAPTICPDTGRVIASWVRLDNRDDLCAALKLDDRETLTDPQIILAAHRAWGNQCANRLEGDFSFVIYEPDKQRFFCAKDWVGARPLYYTQQAGSLVIATSLAVMRQIKTLTMRPNQTWIGWYLSNQSWDPVITAFDNVFRLPPGHYMEVHDGARLEPQRYHGFDIAAPTATRRNPEWVTAYRDVFQNAVNARGRSFAPVGTEMSGGLDSTSITAQLLRSGAQKPDDLHVFSAHYFEREPAFFFDTTRMLGIKNAHIMENPRFQNVGEDHQLCAAVVGHPLEHGLVETYLPHLRRASDLGIRTLLSGFGGDEAATHRADFLRWDLYLQGHRLAALEGMQGNLARKLAILGTMVLGLKKPEAGKKYHILLKNVLANSVLTEAAKSDLGLRQRIDQMYGQMAQARTLNETVVLWPYFQLGLQSRLESYTLVAQRFGLEYRWPLLDRRLVQQYLRTPSIEKRKNGLGRYLHRRAVNGTIPASVTSYPGKDMGAFRGFWENLEPVSELHHTDLSQPLRDLLDNQAYSSLRNSIKDAMTNGAYSETALRGLRQIQSVYRLSAWLDGL